jgi:glycosyltransferase involved in cell wall biosynthesis
MIKQKNQIDISQVSRYVHLGSSGGTERYLLDLILGLLERGHTSHITWLTQDKGSDSLFEDKYGIQVLPLNVPAGYVDVPYSQLCEEYVKYLMNCRVDMAHFHTFSLSEAAMAETAHLSGIPYVFTYHSPAWSCRRGDLLRWGTKICDGEVRSWRCSACMIQQRIQCSPHVAWALTGLLAPLGLLGRFAGGKLHRRTAFIEDTARFRAALRHFLKRAAAVVACSEWSIPVLERNGAPSDRIVHSPQGVSMDFVRAMGQKQAPTRNHAPFTVGYVGRVTPVKGVHLLVEAFAATEYRDARLRIVGCDDSESGRRYLRRLRSLAGNDPRIEFVPKQPFEAMFEVYRSLDLLVIPSVGLETGPLTLLEALALGVEVWGSERIGQMQVLEDYGRVICPNTVTAWRTALESAFEKHSTQEEDRPHRPANVRTMQDVAEEMAALYERLIHSGTDVASQ